VDCSSKRKRRYKKIGASYLARSFYIHLWYILSAKTRYDRPDRDSFIVSIKLNRRYFRQKKKITMRYEQATAEDTIQFMNRDREWKVIDWMISFLKKHSNYSKSDYNTIVWNFDNILDLILRTYHKWVFNKEEKVKTNSNTWIWKKPRPSTFWANITYLSEKLNIHPKQLLQEYTMEQMNWLSEWLIFNSNEASKDGQKINDRLTRSKTDVSNEDLIKKLETLPE
jgi:hypothetical protein